MQIMFDSVLLIFSEEDGVIKENNGNDRSWLLSTVWSAWQKTKDKQG